ncbi:synapse-associated protein [Anaeramoeba flamelloides]|uniref:Synapse-associated protein n=1 Tax=Anaeramoeba flamelloides TaxID=1746091 RepID=A0ABQ8YAF5_9EUKA|nr:synapse-associated protein [Anaeramoeba flamelloides]
MKNFIEVTDELMQNLVSNMKKGLDLVIQIEGESINGVFYLFKLSIFHETEIKENKKEKEKEKEKEKKQEQVQPQNKKESTQKKKNEKEKEKQKQKENNKTNEKVKDKNETDLKSFFSETTSSLFGFVTSTTNIFLEDINEFTNNIKTETTSKIKEIINGSDPNSKTHKVASTLGSLILDEKDQKQPNENNNEKEKEKEKEKTKEKDQKEKEKEDQEKKKEKKKENKEKEEDDQQKVVEEFDKIVLQLQSNKDTYTKDPEDQENFIIWKQNEQIKSRDHEIGLLLSNNKIVDGMFGKLVPDTVSYEDFWKRYFFQLELLRREEKRKKLLEAISESTESSNENTIEKNDNENKVNEKENNKSGIFGQDPFDDENDDDENDGDDDDDDEIQTDNEEMDYLNQDLSELSDLNEEELELDLEQLSGDEK